MISDRPLRKTRTITETTHQRRAHPAGRSRLRLEFCQAVAVCGEREVQQPPVLSQELLVRMSRARAALRDLHSEVTVASLATASRLSRSQFIQRYRDVFGDTPHQ